MHIWSNLCARICPFRHCSFPLFSHHILHRRGTNRRSPFSSSIRLSECMPFSRAWFRILYTLDVLNATYCLQRVTLIRWLLLALCSGDTCFLSSCSSRPRTRWLVSILWEAVWCRSKHTPQAFRITWEMEILDQPRGLRIPCQWVTWSSPYSGNKKYGLCSVPGRMEFKQMRSLKGLVSSKRDTDWAWFLPFNLNFF